MKNKRVKQLEKMLNDRMWHLRYLVERVIRSNGPKQSREMDLVCDEMEFIIEKIKERKNHE